jgi:hypothetical protein
LSPFAERFAVERFSDGGIVVDLLSGSYSRLNKTAATICEILCAVGEAETARGVVAARLRIPPEEAARAIDDVRAALEIPVPRRVRPDPFVYGPAGDQDGYVLSRGTRPRLRVSADGLTVSAASDDEVGDAELFHCLRAVGPKVLFLRGSVVVHGSACQGSSGAWLFCGDSGAGKTTTARAFDAAGHKLLAEDMLVVDAVSPLTFHSGGEAAINAWATAEIPTMREHGRVDTSRLLATVGGASTVVTGIFFIAADRRAPNTERVESRPLGPTEGALAIMTGLFLGATTPPEWRRFLSYAGTIARTPVTLLEARMPDGIEQLRAGARAYIENSAW